MLLRTHRHPRPTLFPYTTLFRSVACNPTTTRGAPADVIIAPAPGPEVLAGSTRLKAGTATKLVLNTLTTAAMARDRKSTRLNSSHRCSSYAVFCLKKKYLPGEVT